MRSTLVAVIKSGKLLGKILNKTDLAFVERWLSDWADDPEWAAIIADARLLGSSPIETANSEIIWFALEARRLAFDVRAGFDPVLIEERKQQAELLELADKAADLASYFEHIERYPGLAAFWHRFLKLPVTPEQDAVARVESSRLRVQQLQILHKEEARLLRQRAEREPKARTFISREKAKREVNAFIHSMTQYLVDFCGKQHRSAVATLVAIAFGRTIDEEEVRKALEGSTRKGRALKRKKRV